MTFERFDTNARRVLVVANEEALGLGHAQLTTGHLLLGLAFVEDDSAGTVLARRGIGPGAVRRALLHREPLRRRLTEPSVFHDETRRAFARALRRTDAARALDVRTGHLLLGLIAEESNVGSQLLLDLGAPAPMLRDEVEVRLAETAGRGAVGSAGASGVVPALAPAVWALLHPENAAVRYAGDPGFLREFVIPGTPEGVGQQIATMRTSGRGQRTTIVEVVERVEGARLVTEQREPLALAVRSIIELTGVDGGTHVSVGFEFVPPAPGDELAEKLARRFAERAQAELARLRTPLEEGWRPAPFGLRLTR